MIVTRIFFNIKDNILRGPLELKYWILSFYFLGKELFEIYNIQKLII